MLFSFASAAGIVTDSDLAVQYEATLDSIVLLKTFDEKRNLFDGDYTADAITAFIKANQLPLVTEFTDEVNQLMLLFRLFVRCVCLPLLVILFSAAHRDLGHLSTLLYILCCTSGIERVHLPFAQWAKPIDSNGVFTFRLGLLVLGVNL